jgi:hypothetical protein
VADQACDAVIPWRECRSCAERSARSGCGGLALDDIYRTNRSSTPYRQGPPLVQTQQRRLMLPILAWPAGMVLAGLCLVALAFLDAQATCPPTADAGLSTCGREPGPWWHSVLLLICLLGPGLYATWHWWRGRRSTTEPGDVRGDNRMR